MLFLKIWIFSKKGKVYTSKINTRTKKICKIKEKVMSWISESPQNTNKILLWKQNVYSNNINERRNII